MPPRPRLSVLTTSGEPRRTAPRGKLWAVADGPEADDFDRLLSLEARRASALHWTPMEVCHRAAQLLALKPGDRLLDVGAGVGKLCVLGSLVSDGHYVGIEQRAPLVLQARALASSLRSSAEFLHGDAFDLDWTGFQALYFYNPFDETRFPVGSQIDGSIQTGPDVFNRLVAGTQERLRQLPVGTRVLTFHGIGGSMPECYRLDVSERIADGSLQLWSRVNA